MKRFSVMLVCQRTSTTSRNSIINNAIKHLAINYRKEFDQLQKHENENSFERIQYLKTLLQMMTKREHILQDINETTKLSNGNQQS